LFWKKEKPKTDTIIIESEDQRESYRYYFKNEKGFYITFKEKKVLTLDISAGGMSFKNNGFQQFDFDFIKFKLYIPNFNGDPTIYAGLRVLKIDPNDICHCIFEQCSLEQHELLHRYVLEMQKNDFTY